MSRAFQNIDPPPPFTARRVCPPPATLAGRKTRDIGLAGLLQ
jgi:hypothetical protein